MPRLVECVPNFSEGRRREVVDLLSEYKKQGGTLFFTSHVLHDVERLADRFGLIHCQIRLPQELADIFTVSKCCHPGRKSHFGAVWKLRLGYRNPYAFHGRSRCLQSAIR